MNYVLYWPLRWLVTKNPFEFRPPNIGVIQASLQARRFASTNDAEVYQHDPELNALQEAERLYGRDPGAAFPQLRALAEHGSIWGMMLTGYAYYAGEGIITDQAQAEYWYRLAFEGGCEQAQLRLGHLYWKQKKLDRCEQVYGVGARDNWAPAMFYLAWVKIRQPKTPDRLRDARTLFEKAAAQGDLGAQMDLGVFMSRGKFGLRLIPQGHYLMFVAAKRIIAYMDQAASESGCTQGGEAMKADSPTM